MRIIWFVMAAAISAPGPVSAGVKPAEFALPTVKISDLKSSDGIKAPAPEPSAAGSKATEQRSIRVCSYMFHHAHGGAAGVGIFAFDTNRAGRVCEIPFFQGQPYGGYRCDDDGNVMAFTDTGEAALLFRKRRADGSSLYHQLNVPADFSEQGKFRGRMKISGKPPKDLSKPLGPNGGGVYSLSCKKAVVAFKAD